ncbi:Ig-like domain-containing protein [Opitutales bacterium]|nr:Ig-like domain-containing protein [Opitutales bacterium]
MKTLIQRGQFPACICAFVIFSGFHHLFADSDRHSRHEKHQSPYEVDEWTDNNGNGVYQDTNTSVKIPIPPGHTIVDWDDKKHRKYKNSHNPKKGDVRRFGSNMIYEPWKHAEGIDSFTWWSALDDQNYSVDIHIVPKPDKMKISLGKDTIDSGTFNFPFKEGSSESTIQLVVDDFDSYSYTAAQKDLNATFEQGSDGKWTSPNPIVLTVVNDDAPVWKHFKLSEDSLEYMKPSASVKSGWKWTWSLQTRKGQVLDYENFASVAELDTNYTMEVQISDGDDEQNFTFHLLVENIDEGPELISGDNTFSYNDSLDGGSWTRNEKVLEDSNAAPLEYTLSFNDDEGDDFFLRFERLKAYDSIEDKRATVSYIYSENNQNITKEFYYDPNATNPTSYADTEKRFKSGEEVTILIEHNIPNAFGLEQYRFTPTNGKTSGSPVRIEVDLENIPDPAQFYWGPRDQIIYLPAPTDPVDVTENTVDVIDLDSIDFDGHIRDLLKIENTKNSPPIYKLFNEEDNHFFDINSSSGIISFKVPPNYEETDPFKLSKDGGMSFIVVVRLYDDPNEVPMSNQSLSLNQQDDKHTLIVNVVDDPSELPQLKSPTGKDYLDDANYSRVIYTQERKSWVWKPSNAFERLAAFSDQFEIEGDYVITWELLNSSFAQPDTKGNIYNHEVIINQDDSIRPSNYNGKQGPFEFEFIPDPSLRGGAETGFEIGFSVDDGPSRSIDYRVVIEDVPDPPILAPNGIRLEATPEGLKPKYNERSRDFFPISPDISETSEDYEIVFYENHPLHVTLEFTAEGDGGETIEYVKVLNTSEDLSSFNIQTSLENNNGQVHLILPNAENFDYENLGDRNYTLQFEVKDSSEIDILRNNPRFFTFTFILTDENEAPIVTQSWEKWGSPKSVPEEQSSLLSLSANDPEDLDGNVSFKWELMGQRTGDSKRLKDILYFEPQEGRKVDLKFIDGELPNYEDFPDLNVTFKVTPSTGLVNETPAIVNLEVSFTNVQDPPKIKSEYADLDEVDLGKIRENNVVIIENLGDFFNEESPTEYFLTDPESEIFNVIGSTLIFKNPLLYADFEFLTDSSHIGRNGYDGKYEVSVHARTEVPGLEEKLKFIFEIENDHLETPVAIDPSTYRTISTDDLNSSATIIWEVNQTIDGSPILEDQNSTISLNLDIYDPQDRQSGLQVSGLEGMNLHVGQIKDDHFWLYPPANTFGPTFIDLNISSVRGSSYVRLLVQIQDQPDKPTLQMIKDDGSTLDPADKDFNGTVYIEEGKVLIRELLPLDAKDDLSDGRMFFWKIDSTSTDKDYFKLSSYNSSLGQSVQLLWNLDKLEEAYGARTSRYDVPNQWRRYDIELVLSERAEGAEADSDYNESDIFTNRFPVSIVATDSTIPPVPVETQNVQRENDQWVARYKEGTPFSISLHFRDYDNVDPQENNGVTTVIKYQLTSADAVNHFSIDPLEGGSTQLILQDEVILDYENPTNKNSVGEPNEYLVKIRSTKWNRYEPSWDDEKEAYLDENQTQFSSTMNLVVKVENTIEKPYFLPVDSGLFDTDFSLDEQTYKSFTLEAGTDDFEKELQISLLDDKDSWYFSTFENEGNRTKFKFTIPPDFENPRDSNRDNIYDISFRVSSVKDPSVYVDQVFRVKVNDLESSLKIMGEGSDKENSFAIYHPENRKFVADFDVEDLEGEYNPSKDFLDLVFTTDEGVHFVPNSWDENQPTTLFNSTIISDDNKSGAFSTTQISSDPATISMFGDVNNDGAVDVVSINTSSIASTIKVYINDGLGNFTENDTAFENTYTDLDHAILVDLDTDGDQDLVAVSKSLHLVHIFENKSDQESIGFVELGEGYELTESSHGLKFPTFVAVSDIDGDDALDLVVANAGKDQVNWYRNEGSLEFSSGAVVAQVSQPFCLEIVKRDDSAVLGNPFECHDILIGAKGKVLLAENDNRGGFQISTLADSTKGESHGFDEGLSTCIAIKALDLDVTGQDTLTDLVYLTSRSNTPYFIIQKDELGISTYKHPNSFFDYDSYASDETEASLMEDVRSLEVYRASNEHCYVFVGSEMKNFTWVFKAEGIDDARGVRFGEPLDFLIPSEINSLGLADLDRKVNFVKFSIDQSYNDFGLFDQDRVASGGKLFFKDAPDYEKGRTGIELEDEKLGIYKVKLSAYIDGDVSNSTSQNITIYITDTNDPPTIDEILFSKKLNQKISASQSHIVIEHDENKLEVFEEIKFSNQENDQNVTFSRVGGSDADQFVVDEQTGRLAFSSDHNILTQSGVEILRKYGVVNFLNMPDFEKNSSHDLDGNFSVIVRATDQGGEFDERSFTIVIQDTNEQQSDILIHSYSSLSLTTLEDEFVAIKDLHSLISSTSPNQLIFSIYPGDNTLQLGEAEIQQIAGKSDFYYYPDHNRSGIDQVFIKVDDGSGALFCVAVEINITPVPDAPVSLIPSRINVDENKKKVVELLAKDGDEGDEKFLSWSLTDPEDPIFKIVDNNGADTLYFKAAPDYEDPNAWGGGNVYYADMILFDRDQVHSLEVILEVRVQNLPDSLPESILVQNEKNIIRQMEGQNLIMNLEASDPDAVNPGQADGLVMVVSGLDSSHFVIEDGLLKVFGGATLDYENPVDANQDNKYELNIYIADSALSATYETVVEILDLDENPPYFETGKGQMPYEISAPENQKFVVQAIAADGETSDLTYSVIGGGEEGFFKIDSLTGVLEYKEPQNFEFPEDNNNDGRYEVIIQVSDGTHNVSQTIITRLTDTNDLPYVTPPRFTAFEDQSFSTNLNIIDEDGDDFEMQFVSGVSYGTLDLGSSSFSYNPVLNFNGSDSFVLDLADDQGRYSQTIFIDVTPTNDPPVAVDDLKYFYQTTRIHDPVIFINVLTNDHSGPDDPSEKNFYQVESINLSTTNGNALPPPSSSGVFEYRPPAGFMGEDRFQYKLIDNGLEDTATVRIWVATSADMPEWTNLMFFGSYYRDANVSNGRQNWIYHVDMGWVYVYKPDQLLESSWMWKENVGWFWTGDKYFKWVYHQGLQQWLHWEGNINSSNGWFLRTEDEVKYYEKDFVRMQVRDEVIEILPDIWGLSTFIQQSSFFSRTEMVKIVQELNRYGRSSTLNKILQFDFSY